MAGDQNRHDTGELWSASSIFTRIMGFSIFASLFSNTYAFDSFKLLVFGSILETCRRLCQWLYERLRFQYSITAQFDEGDPAHEWIILFLTEQNVWRRSRDVRVTAKSSSRKWGVETVPNSQPEGSADYVPTYELPQLFRWNGHWHEVKRTKGTPTYTQMGVQFASTTFITIHTIDMTTAPQLVETARLRYVEVSRPNVIVHTADTEQPHIGPTFTWKNVKRNRRPLDSTILKEGLIDSIVGEAWEFLDMEDWYIDAGISHRRGYVLYGPHPMPLLPAYLGMMRLGPRLSSRMRSVVTLSGLLNAIDVVGSEEGKLFFATTNYIDNLDPALLRPGRIDCKIQYKLATREQATALFLRFFPPSYITFEGSEALSVDEKQFKLGKLAKTFSQGVPESEFSTVELQGYLLSRKKHPEQPAVGIGAWVEQERIERKEKKAREIERKAKEQKSRDEVTQMQFVRMGGLDMMAKLGGRRKVGDIPRRPSLKLSPGPFLKLSPGMDGSDESDSESLSNGRRTLAMALPGASVESLSLSTGSLSQPDMAFTDGFTSDSDSISVSTLPIPA